MSDWWRHGIVYQVYPRSFQDTNGDGVGDLPGITDRLPYLAQLGVDAVWISPIYLSPMADFGYDVADYTDVHELFGTLDDADRLIETAHDLGLKVILDYVVNHSSDQHPWFQESRSSRDNPKRDWYFWKDPGPDGGPPTNWVSRFGGGSAWEFDEPTGQYYLHTYLAEQPDLNWGNEDLRNAMLDVLRFWMDRGVDGFRVDVAYRAKVAPQWRDNPPNPEWKPGMDPYEKLQETYTKNLPDAHVVGRMLRDVVDEYDDRVLIGEVTLPVDRLTAFYGEDANEYHLPFNFNLIHSEWTAEAVQQHVDAYERHVPESGWPNYVLGNHDQHRLAARVGPGQARVGYMLLLTLRGTPTLYYGDELGMLDGRIPPGMIQDPWELKTPDIGLGRDPARTPMQWSPALHAGFCPPDAEPWLPVGPKEDVVNVEVQRDQPASMLSLTKRLIRLRRKHPALHAGSYRSFDAPDGVFAYARSASTDDADRFVVVLNFTGETRTWSLAEGVHGKIKVSTRYGRQDEAVSGIVPLRPDEGVLICVDRSA
ncbi:alpha-amylase [Longibacter salinarum]|uniref:Alpha-amylase n=1 Tax=Longibacter salinarum TaxID=1850348 RepID=A0A2A8D0T1_9BACT|nr:alpha-amylase family glycosyl hydrolase [Longibacter salinarum]PEN14413.1 alpha-amylase [Longibacter salinarum]